MAEKPFTGLTASLKIGASTGTTEVLAYVSGVDLSLEKEIIEILQFGAEFKEKVPAIKDWSASIEGTLAISSTGTQKQLYDAFSSGELITIEIYLDESTFFSGAGYVSSFSLSAAPDDKITLSSELAGSGATVLTLGGAAMVEEAAEVPMQKGSTRRY